MDGELKEYQTKMNFKTTYPVSKEDGFEARQREGEQDEWSEAQLLTMTNESFSNDQKDEESSSQSLTRNFPFISDHPDNFGGPLENARVLQYYRSDEIEASGSQQDISQPSFSLSSIKKKPRPTVQEFTEPKLEISCRNSLKTNAIGGKTKHEKIESDEEQFFENEISINLLTKKHQVKEVIENGLDAQIYESKPKHVPPKPKSKSKPLFGSLRIDIEEANKTEGIKLSNSGQKDPFQPKENIPEAKSTDTMIGMEVVRGFFTDQMNKLTEKNESLLRENERIKLELEVLQKKRDDEEDYKKLLEESRYRCTLLEEKLVVKEEELKQASQLAIKKEIEISKLKSACESLELAHSQKQETSLGILSRIHDYRLQAYKNMKSNRSKAKFSESCQSQEPNIHFHVTTSQDPDVPIPQFVYNCKKLDIDNKHIEVKIQKQTSESAFPGELYSQQTKPSTISSKMLNERFEVASSKPKPTSKGSVIKPSRNKENPFMGNRGIAEALLNLKLRESKNSKMEDDASSKKTSLIESRTGSNDIDDISVQNTGTVCKVGGKPLSSYGGHKKTSSLKYSENARKEIGKYFVSNATRQPKLGPSLYCESLYYKSTPYTKPPLEEHFREEPEMFSQTAPFQLNEEKLSRKSIFKTGEDTVKLTADRCDHLSKEGNDNSIFGDQNNLKFRKKRTLHCLLNQANDNSLPDRPNEELTTSEFVERGQLDQSGSRNSALRPKPF